MIHPEIFACSYHRGGSSHVLQKIFLVLKFMLMMKVPSKLLTICGVYSRLFKFNVEKLSNLT